MQLKNLSISAFRNILITFGVITTLAFYIFRFEGTTGGYFSTAASIIALLAALFGVRHVTSSLGGGPKHFAFCLIFTGILSTVIGLSLWAYFVFTGQFQLAGTIPQLLYLTTYVINFIGFLILGITTRIKIQGFFGMIIGFGILGLILLTIGNSINPIGFNLISTGYLIGDSLRIIIIALLLQMVVIYQGGLLGRYWLSIFIGNLFIFIANFASDILYQQYASGLWPFTLIDLIFIGGYLFVAHGYYGIGDSIRFVQKKILEHKK